MESRGESGMTSMESRGVRNDVDRILETRAFRNDVDGIESFNSKRQTTIVIYILLKNIGTNILPQRQYHMMLKSARIAYI